MVSMAVLTPFFDIVAGVAILAGRSSLLDAKVFRAANNTVTFRQLLALGFIGYGGWNLWQVEKAQEKLKESLEAEGVSDLLPVGTKVRSYDFWPYNKDTYIEGVIEKIAPSPRCSPNCMHYHIRRTKTVRDGLEGREDLIGTMFMTHPYEDGWDADYEGQLAKHIIPFKSSEVSEIKGGESFAAMTKADIENRAAIKRKYRQEFKNWVKKPYPYEVRVTQDTKGDYCESCGDIRARPEGEGVHYQFVLPRQDSWRSKYRWIEGDYCRGCGSDMCQRCVDGDNYCDSCGELLCNSCRQEYENYGGDCPELHYQAESFNAAYLQDPASEYGGPTEMILDTCPVCAEFSNDMTPKELWPRWGVEGSMEYMCDDCWNAMETDPYAQWLYTQEAESFSAQQGQGQYTPYCEVKSEDHMSQPNNDAVGTLHGKLVCDQCSRDMNQDPNSIGQPHEEFIPFGEFDDDGGQVWWNRCAECDEWHHMEYGFSASYGEVCLECLNDYATCSDCGRSMFDYHDCLDIPPSEWAEREGWKTGNIRWDDGEGGWVHYGCGEDGPSRSQERNEMWPVFPIAEPKPKKSLLSRLFRKDAESFSADEDYRILHKRYFEGAIGDEGMFKGGEIRIHHKGNYGYIIHYLDEHGNKAGDYIAVNKHDLEKAWSPFEVRKDMVKHRAESFSAESRDELIDTLIEIRQELAREEGMEDWENESEGPLDSLSSAFIQELIWYMDGDRDTWDAESLTSPRPPKNSIEWGIYDNPSELMRLVNTEEEIIDEYNLLDMPTGALSQMQSTPHPDGAVFPCSMCDEIDGTPEYCAGVKWQLDEGLAGLHTSCDEQLQRSIHERTKELHSDIEKAKSGKSLFTSPLDSVEWISRIEPADWPYVERVYGYKNAGAESFSADTFDPAELGFGDDVVVLDSNTGYDCPFEVEELSDDGLFTYTVCNQPLELVYHVADGITSDEPFYTYECSGCNEGFQAIYTVCTRNGEKISEDWQVGENIYGWAAEQDSYNAEHDSYGPCGCGDHEVADDDYNTCETCGTIWEFPDCTSGVCGICFKVCDECNPKKRKKHYRTCTLEG